MAPDSTLYFTQSGGGSSQSSHLWPWRKPELLFLKVKSNCLFLIVIKVLEIYSYNVVGKASHGLQNGWLNNKLYSISNHKKSEHGSFSVSVALLL